MVASICLLIIITLVYMYYKLITGLNSYLHFSLDPRSYLRRNHTLPHFTVGRLQATKFKYSKLKSRSQEMGRRKWQPTPVFLPRESGGQRRLVGCRLWGCTESDTTEAT